MSSTPNTKWELTSSNLESIIIIALLAIKEALIFEPLIQNQLDTIVAPATPTGISALAVIRISGTQAIEICGSCFKKDLSEAKPYTIHYGYFKDGDQFLDEVLLSIFKNPRSYTGEDSVEISCHGSPYIAQRIIETLCKNGARMAEAGEFTLRAFLNGKLDLAQAEAVADMISSNSELSLQMAISQMRGGFSKEIAVLRQELIDFVALIELENDFGEEDVEFANREKLQTLITQILSKITALRDSFSAGNVLKHGISTVIAGKPNAGKSTLLNALLKEDRAIVTDIAGTTRDTIEEVFTLNGVQFRLIDTAGIRESTDEIESIGVARAMAKMEEAELLIYLFDLSNTSLEELNEDVANLPEKEHVLLVGNKNDQARSKNEDWPKQTLFVSAKEGDIQALLIVLKRLASEYKSSHETLVNNIRHADALHKSAKALQKALDGLGGKLSSDLVALDLRTALYQLGLITGEVTNDEVLESIFSRFCIGK